MGKTQRIAPEIKEQVIKRVKEEGISIKQAADEHGISDRIIYRWLEQRVDGGSTTTEMIKLRRENQALTTLVGELTIKLSQTQKKKWC